MIVRHALLALLSEGPKYGFQLAQEFEAGTGEMWPLNTGQVYTTLQRLERDELVETDDTVEGGPQNSYRITESGLVELEQWLHTPPDTSRPPRDELVIKVLVALRIPGVDVIELTQAYRRHVVEAMRQYTRLKEEAHDDDIGLLLVADAEIYRLDSVIRWLDAAEARIRRLPAPSERTRLPARPGETPSSRSQAMTAALEMSQVSKSYGEGATIVHALQTVDLSVNPGELVAIMGPSGSGKSTLLTIAGTLEEATSGRVCVDGQDTSQMSRNDRARLRRRSIGYVFQDFNLLAGLTAAENVSLPLELDGLRTRAARRVALEALEELGLADRADSYPDDLSGGERQRVAIARAVVGDRRLLLADEPTGALDSVNGEGVMRLVRAACKRGVAGVMVTHDAQLASWADRVVFLRDGRVVDQTAPTPGPESLLSPVER